jgi:hypothetical protein
MSIGFIFWLIMLIWLLFALAWNFNWSAGVTTYGPFGNSLLLFILFALLGWRVFGAAIHG